MTAPYPLAEPAAPDVDDGHLLSRYRAGDVEAASLLYEAHREGLFTYALSLLTDRAAAEDVVQEAFLRLFGYTRPVLSVLAFLCAVVRNLATDARREAAARTKSRAEVAVRGLTRVAQEDERLNRLQREALLQLDRLPEEQRETVVLKIYGRLTFPQIAEVMGVPPGTAASRYRYALEKMAQELARGEERA